MTKRKPKQRQWKAWAVIDKNERFIEALGLKYQANSQSMKGNGYDDKVIPVIVTEVKK